MSSAMHTSGDSGLSGGVPAFLTKLWTLVEDPSTNAFIEWDSSGRSFHVYDQGQFAKDILPLYFKHSNIASFVRQLNMYGFRKIMSVEQGALKTERDDMQFAHQHFLRDHPENLEYIKRKVRPQSEVGAVKTEEVKLKQNDVTKVLTDVRSMKGKQESLSSKLEQIQRENEALWREVASLRQKHMKQQQIVNKLIQFLITMIGTNRPLHGMKRKMPLMINDATQLQNAAKVPKFSRQLSINTSDPPHVVQSDSNQRGLTIHDVTDVSPTVPGMKKEVPVSQASPMAPTQTGCPATTDSTSLAQPADTNNPISWSMLDQQSGILDTSVLSDLQESICSGTGDGAQINAPYVTSPQPSPLNSSEGEALTVNIPTSTSSAGVVTMPPSPKREEIAVHLDSVQNELDSLKDVLSGGQYSFDANTLLGLFSPEAPFPSSSETISQLLDELPVTLQTETAPSSSTSTDPNFINGTELIQYNPQEDLGTLFDSDLIPPPDALDTLPSPAMAPDIDSALQTPITSPLETYVCSPESEN